LIGLYVGVLPVALGLLWYPLMRRLGPAGRDFVLALTVGLLVFLLVDTVEDGLEAGRELAGAYQGRVLFVLVAALAYLGIEALGPWLASRRGTGLAWTRALLVAIGIGLHNFGEGLAIGAAFALGELALGTLLILGFTLHNTTEGLAIVAPLGATRVRWTQLLGLGLLAGAPTILGAWLGGFTYSLLWSVVFLAVGAGAIAQVAVQIARGTAGERAAGELLASRPVLGGLLAGFAVMYLTGLLVG
ncbi:MAG: ZIP family metal transporter, partial [Thermoanaerobaculia bacterium]